MAEQGIVFPVRRCEIDYLTPARLGDELEVQTMVRAVGGASIDLDQDVTRAGAGQDTPGLHRTQRPATAAAGAGARGADAHGN